VAVRHKRRKIVGGGWRYAGTTDLLLYQNSEQIGPNLRVLTAILRASPRASLMVRESPGAGARGTLGRVSLLTGRTLVHDIWGACAVLSAPAAM